MQRQRARSPQDDSRCKPAKAPPATARAPDAAHDAAGLMVIQRNAGNHAVSRLLAGGSVVLMRDDKPASGATAPAPAPGPPVPTGGNFTPAEAALLGKARATLQPQGNAIVGVLIPEGGKPIFLQSGGGQGFSSHVEGKATTVMREQGIARARLIVELEPCQICDRSTYPGPDVPSGGVTGSASGKQIPLQTSKINTALPAGTKLTVVGPESTGIYEGVRPSVSPRAPVVPSVGDPLPHSQPAQSAVAPKTAAPGPGPAAQGAATTPKTGSTPAVEPVPTPTRVPAVKPVSPVRAGLKAGGQALGWTLLFAGLQHLANRRMQKELEADIDRTRPHMLKWAQHEKTKKPDAPVYLVVKVRFDDYSNYMVLVGWLPDRKLSLASVGVTDRAIDPPRIEVEDHSLNILRPGKTTEITYTELLIQ
jgi:hypothetical protein